MRRKTGQREAILGYLKRTGSHPTADDTYNSVRKVIPNISKGTIYRNLRVLQEMGQVRELNLDGEISRYEATCCNHYHFRCELCGRVMDIDEPEHLDLQHKIARRTGLKITSHQIEFRGLCIDCQRKDAGQTGIN
ncbi:MAG: transcriptional repressor [Dehalococcoidia bacterium]|nr:transcriptional repressor [Dehalococcoidia bacterium]